MSRRAAGIPSLLLDIDDTEQHHSSSAAAAASPKELVDANSKEGVEAITAKLEEIVSQLDTHCPNSVNMGTFGEQYSSPIDLIRASCHGETHRNKAGEIKQAHGIFTFLMPTSSKELQAIQAKLPQEQFTLLLQSIRAGLRMIVNTITPELDTRKIAFPLIIEAFHLLGILRGIYLTRIHDKEYQEYENLNNCKIVITQGPNIRNLIIALHEIISRNAKQKYTINVSALQYGFHELLHLLFFTDYKELYDGTLPRLRSALKALAQTKSGTKTILGLLGTAKLTNDEFFQKIIDTAEELGNLYANFSVLASQSAQTQFKPHKDSVKLASELRDSDLKNRIVVLTALTQKHHTLNGQKTPAEIAQLRVEACFCAIYDFRLDTRTALTEFKQTEILAKFDTRLATEVPLDPARISPATTLQNYFHSGLKFLCAKHKITNSTNPQLKLCASFIVWSAQQEIFDLADPDFASAKYFLKAAAEFKAEIDAKELKLPTPFERSFSDQLTYAIERASKLTQANAVQTTEDLLSGGLEEFNRTASCASVGLFEGAAAAVSEADPFSQPLPACAGNVVCLTPQKPALTEIADTVADNSFWLSPFLKPAEQNAIAEDDGFDACGWESENEESEDEEQENSPDTKKPSPQHRSIALVTVFPPATETPSPADATDEPVALAPAPT